MLKKTKENDVDKIKSVFSVALIVICGAMWIIDYSIFLGV